MLFPVINQSSPRRTPAGAIGACRVGQTVAPVMKTSGDNYRRALDAQHEALRVLLEERGCNMAAISALAGVSEYQARKWTGDQLARRHTRQLLKAAAAGDVRLEPLAKGPRGALNEKDRARRERLLTECKLTPAPVRVRTLLRMINTLHVTREEFARLLDVRPVTLFNYLNPEYEHGPALPVVLRIKKLMRDIERGRAPATLNERFRRAALTLFGKEIFEGGFDDRHKLKAEVFAWMSEVGGISGRTLYRWGPPYPKKVRPSRRLVEAFETAAKLRGASPLKQKTGAK